MTTQDEPLTVQILQDVFDGIEHYYGSEGLEMVAEFARMKNRARESNKLIDELEAQFGPFEKQDAV
jgi:hypothetical protein